MRKPYESYAEIPVLMRDYLLTVAEKKNIMDIPLEDINGYIRGLDEYYKWRDEEYFEGWVD
jgi:hypothetical protein